MSIFGRLLGGALKPVAEIGGTALRERGQTLRARDTNLTAREQARLAATLGINAGASTWRPKWMHAIKNLLVAYFTLSFIGAVLALAAMASVFLEWSDYSQWATIKNELVWLLESWGALGGSLITVATWSFLGYSPFRSFEKMDSGSVGNGIQTVKNLAKRVVPEKAQHRPVQRVDIDLADDEGIERIPGVQSPIKAKPLTSAQLRSIAREIKEDEGYRSRIYKDTLGNLTVGFGHLIKPNDPEYGKPVGYEITSQRAHELFNRDMALAIDAASNVVHDFDSLPFDARAVLINMAFQLGETGLSRFQMMLEAIQDGDWKAAADEAMDSRWALQTPNRAKRMADRLRSLAS